MADSGSYCYFVVLNGRAHKIEQTIVLLQGCLALTLRVATCFVLNVSWVLLLKESHCHPCNYILFRAILCQCPKFSLTLSLRMPTLSLCFSLMTKCSESLENDGLNWSQICKS